MDPPNFASIQEEVKYWRDKAKEYEDKAINIEREYDEFRDQSAMLEKELEQELEQSEKTSRELRTKCNRVYFDLDSAKDKITHLTKENGELLNEVIKYRESEEKLLKIIRELEQKNDDVERLHRQVMVTVEDIKTQLDSQIEKNALLETELDEKVALQVMVQRLKDEQRDLQQELARQLRQRFPDNDKVIESRLPRTPNFACNKLIDAGASSPIRSSMDQLSPPSRLSALNLVGDLLRKVGTVESKLSAARIPKESTASPGRESYRSRNQRMTKATSAVKL